MTMAHQTREKKKPAPRVVANAKTRPRRGSPARKPIRAVRPPTANVPIEAIDEQDSELSVLTLIRGFQSGAINPKTISMESRRACVEHLTADGFSVPEIAQVLQASARNIARDRAAMREAHSVEASPALTRQMVGHMLREAEVTVNRLRRFARGNDAAIIEKIEAEKSAWGVTRDMLQMLQRLGYLPSAPSVIQGHVTHQQLESLNSPEELQREVLRLERICLEDPAMAGDPHALQIIKQVKNTAKTLAAPARSNSDRPRERRPS